MRRQVSSGFEDSIVALGCMALIFKLAFLVAFVYVTLRAIEAFS